jgi:atypical dual specificity phosphatase
MIEELRFGFLSGYPVAGMGEPWSMKIEPTHRFLRDHGVGAILTLTEDDLYGARHREAGFLQLHEPVDDGEPPDPEGMLRALEFIDACMDQEIGVAVHCMEGRGRTGTVLCAWLGRREALGPDEAIQRIFSLRPCTVLSPRQRWFLERFLRENGRGR